jgi:hypothetical protein
MFNQHHVLDKVYKFMDSNPDVYLAGKWEATAPVRLGEAGVVHIIQDGKRR